MHLSEWSLCIRESLYSGKQRGWPNQKLGNHAIYVAPPSVTYQGWNRECSLNGLKGLKDSKTLKGRNKSKRRSVPTLDPPLNRGGGPYVIVGVPLASRQGKAQPRLQPRLCPRPRCAPPPAPLKERLCTVRLAVPLFGSRAVPSPKGGN